MKIIKPLRVINGAKIKFNEKSENLVLRSLTFTFIAMLISYSAQLIKYSYEFFAILRMTGKF